MGHTHIVPRLLLAPAAPVTPAEFVNSLLSAWKVSKCSHLSQSIGLAISGGVDSMALAALCSRVQHSSRHIIPVEGQLKFQAFVVDHGVRKGSDFEAQAVSKVLEDRGISTRVLKIRWPGYLKPAEMPNFESIARKQRFQVLGRACRDLGINSLLLAHHEDDQAETVMMRLVSGHRMLGLRGIKDTSEIPECHGIYGVHESGGADTPVDGDYSKNWSSQPRIPQCAWDLSLLSSPFSNISRQLVTESGGIEVYRPLLGFSKARLIATCQSAKMKWFEDHTNKDPTLTMRNAIRHIYRSYALPNALTKPALLTFSRKSKEVASLLLDKANSQLLKCCITHFETRTGIVGIRFVDMNELSVRSGTCPPKEGRQIAAILLQRVIKLVTPEEHVPLSSLHGSIERVFPELFSYDKSARPPASFTVAGVLFRLVDVLPASVERPSSAKNHGTKDALKCQWLISRQPYALKTSRIPVVIVPSTSDVSTTDSWSQWSLYDGRFWIRIQNRSLKSLHIRPYRKDDSMGFRDSLSKADRGFFRRILKELAPGDVRWTLPAIALREADGNERVLALPTLDISIPEFENLVSWEVRYKKVNTDGVRLPQAALIGQAM